MHTTIIKSLNMLFARMNFVIFNILNANITGDKNDHYTPNYNSLIISGFYLFFNIFFNFLFASLVYTNEVL